MPTTIIDPTDPQPIVALPPDARQQAYAQLLAQSEQGRSDRGASAPMMADILNRVDMGGADRASSMWDTHRGAYATASDAMLGQVGAAYAAQRAKRAAGRRRTSGMTVPRAPVTPAAQQTDWLTEHLALLQQRPTTGGGGGRLTVR